MQIDAEMWSFLNDKEKLSCLRGESLYKEIAQSGQASFIAEKVKTLTDDEIYCLLLFYTDSDLDLEKDAVAYEIVDNCLKVQMERHPLDTNKDAAYERFKRMLENKSRRAPE